MKKTIFALVIFSFLILGLSALAQDNNLPSPGLTPDNPFYFLKTWKESIQTFFTFGAENKAKQFLHLSEIRLAEYKKMIEKGKTEIAQKTLKKYEKQLSYALEKADQTKKEGKYVEELAILITEKTLKHQKVLLEVFKKVPEKAKTAIQKAIEVSKKGSKEAVEAVSGIKKEELRRKAEEVRIKMEKEIEVEISCKNSLDCPSQMKCENSICVNVGCIEAGHRTPIVAVSPEGIESLEHIATECCEGLKAIHAPDEFDENCSLKPIVVGVIGRPQQVCSKCGNGVCEEWETKCNCLGDCKAVECLKEEETYMPGEDRQCCAGLKAMTVTFGDGITCTLPMGYVCTAFCGDGKCEGEYENACSCPKDCFLLEAPVLKDPGISVNKHEPFTLNWTSIKEAKRYWLQRDTSTNFSIPTWYCEINSNTDNPGIGTSYPEVSTTYYYRVKACDDQRCSAWSNVVDMRVIVPTSITIISPNGGEIWYVENTYTIYWEQTGLTKVDIKLLSQKMGAPSSIYKVTNIATDIDATKGSYLWHIPVEIPISSISDSPYLFDYPCHKIEVVDSRYGRDSVVTKVFSDQSDDCFSIVSATTTPRITVFSPNGGEVWEIGKTYTIQWSLFNLPVGNNIDIELIGVDEAGNSVRKTLFSSLPHDSTGVNWLVPADSKGKYQIRVISYAFACGGNQSTCLDDSNTSFSIVITTTL